jgi:Gas vesicle synthesis protein GvpO
MADSATGRRGERDDGRPPRDEEEERREDESGSEGDRPEGGLSAKELAEAAATTIADLTGFEPESVAGLQWDGESWLVTVDVVEVARIPDTTDLLASYVVQLDDGGGLLGYKRTRRFVRGQVDEG